MLTPVLSDADLRASILGLIAEHLEPGVRLAPEVPLDSLDMDSFDLIELAQALGDEFGVTIGATDVREAETLGDIIDAALASR